MNEKKGDTAPNEVPDISKPTPEYPPRKNDPEFVPGRQSEVQKGADSTEANPGQLVENPEVGPAESPSIEPSQTPVEH